MLKYWLPLLFTLAVKAQTHEYVYRNPADSTLNCYLKIIPKGEIKGMVVRDYSRLPDMSRKSPFKLTDDVVENGLVMLYTVTSKKFPALYYQDAKPALLEDIINEVIMAHNIPKNNIFIGGISASGTRALRFAQYCAQGKSKYGTSIKGAFVVDSPLDQERFYQSALWHKNHFKKGMLWEAKQIVKNFPKFIGDPKDGMQAYRDVSVYSYTDTTGGNARYLKDLNLIIFHEPDMDWWLPERGAGYFDINSFDLVGFTAKLRHLGNDNVELITTTGKGYNRQGERNCHSWTIVDEEYLLSWILHLVE